ncbi:MAG: hypothetical protein Q4Q03_05400, partial [Bowdeniella nasicola]|nr:hypothetical protein [Bowdeniella nasicola]
QSQAHIPQSIHSRLVHHEVQLYADDADIRVLHFKGTIAALHFPDRHTNTSDADILCEPDRFEKLIARLERSGWSTAPHQPEPAAVALIHPQRGVSVDLYRYFPGLEGQWSQIFADLYRRREIVENCWPYLTIPNQLDHGALLLADIMSGDTIHQHHSRNRASIYTQIPAERRTEFYERMAQIGVIHTIFPTGGRTINAPQRRRVAAVTSKSRFVRLVGTRLFKAADATDMRQRLHLVFGGQPSPTTIAPAPSRAGKRIADEVVWMRDKDETVSLLDLRTGTPARLFGSASHIWELLVSGCSDSEIVEIFKAEISELPANAPAQIHETIGTLTQLDLIDTD